MPAAPKPVLDVRIGDRLRLARRHPCGGSEWLVVRLGADIGLDCTTCTRRVMLERPQLERRLVGFSARGSDGRPDESRPDEPRPEQSPA